MPVDISQNALDNLEADLNIQLFINQEKQGDYFGFKSLKDNKTLKRFCF
jgi:hypothetical protein